MKKKAKKVLSLVLALSMVLSMLCFNASAAYNSGASYTYTSSDGSFKIHYNGTPLDSDVGYTLYGATQGITDICGIEILNSEHELNDTDYIDNGVLVAGGKLVVTDCHVSNTFTINEGAELVMNDSDYTGIVHGNGGKLTVSHGTVYATGTFAEINGTVKTYEGNDTLTINGGTATVDSTEKNGSYDGYANTITINGGTVKVKGSRNSYDDNTDANDTLVINGGTVTAYNNNDFYAVTLTGGTYDFNGKNKQPTINGGVDGEGTLKIGNCDATIKGSFAKIESGTGDLYLAGDTAIGETASASEMHVYSDNSSYNLTLGDGTHEAKVNLVSKREGTSDDNYQCTFTSVGTVTVYANARVSVFGNNYARVSNSAYTVGKFVGKGGSVYVCKNTHDYNYYDCAGDACSIHESGGHYHSKAFDVDMTNTTFEGEFAKIDMNGRMDAVSDSTTPATIKLSGDTVIERLTNANTIDANTHDLTITGYDANTATTAKVQNVKNLTVGDGVNKANVTVVGPVKDATVKENATLILNEDETVEEDKPGTAYITGTVTGANGTFTNNDAKAVTTTGTFKGGTGGNQGGGSENDLTLTTDNSNQTVTGTYGTLTIDGATDVELTGTVDKLIVNSGDVTMKTGGSAKEVVVKNGATFTMTDGKVENLAVAANEYKAVTVEAGGTFNMNGGEITLQPSAEYCNSTKLTAVENAGTAKLKNGTINIYDGTGNRAVCNHKKVEIGDKTTTAGGASADKTLTINMLRGTAIRNDVQEANTTVYDVAITIGQNDLTAGSIGMDAAFGKFVVNSGVDDPKPEYVPAVTVSADVVGDQGIALYVGPNTAWQVAGSYGSATFTAATAMKTLSGTSAVDDVKPLSVGVFDSLANNTADIVYADKTTGNALDIYTLIPALNFYLVTDNKLDEQGKVTENHHQNEGWMADGANKAFETGKLVVVDAEWELRHAATLEATYMMPTLDANNTFAVETTDDNDKTIFLDENQNKFWGAMGNEDDLNVTGVLTLDLNGKVLTEGGVDGAAFASLGAQLVTVTGTLTVNDSYDSVPDVTGQEATLGVQTIGKIDAKSYFAIVNKGTLTVNAGTIYGKTMGIDNATGGTIEAVNGGTIEGGNRGINNNYNAYIYLITGDTTVIFGSNTAIVNQGTITKISGGTIGKKGENVSLKGVENYNSNAVIGTSEDAAENGIVGGKVYGGTALKYTYGAIYNISGDTFIGTTWGMEVAADAKEWNFLRVQQHVTPAAVEGGTPTIEVYGATFSSISIAGGNTLDDLFVRSADKDDVLTLKDSTEGGAIELGGNSTLRVAPELKNEFTVKPCDCVTGGVTAPTATQYTAPFTVIPRTHYEVLVSFDNAGAEQIENNTDNRYDDAIKVLFVKAGAQPALKLKAAEGKLLKDVAYEDLAENGSNTPGTAVAGTNSVTVGNFENNDYLGAYVNKADTTFTVGAITVDKAMYVCATDTKVITYKETSPYVNGSATYQFINAKNNEAYADTPATKTLTTDGSFNIAKGNAVKFTFTPATDHAIHSFKVNGTDGSFDGIWVLDEQGAAYSYTYTINNDTTLTLEYCDMVADELKGSASIYVGDTVNVKNGDAHIDSSYTWDSSDDAVATVADGIVTGHKAGRATIYLMDGDTEVAHCTVTVKNRSYGGGGGGGGVTTYKVTCGTGVKADKASAASGATVKLTVSEGYEDVVVKDAKGNKIEVTNNTFKMPASNVTVSVTKIATATATTYDKCDKGELCVLNSFTDVNAKQWYHDGVHFCLDNGMMNGVGDGQFAPSASTTRAMIWTVLARLNGVESASGANWYVPCMEWAMANGVSDGTNPNGNITREQLAAMLYRYAAAKGYDVTALAELTGFADADSVSAYAVDAMKWAVSAGIINGDNGNLKPTAGATRAEVATMLMRFCEKVAK